MNPGLCPLGRVTAQFSGVDLKQLRSVVSLITDDNDYQRQQAAAAQETATRLGVAVRTIFANCDAIDQSQQLLDVIHSRDGVDGILVEPAGRTGFPKVAQAAVASGKAWVLLNCEADYLRELRSRYNVPVFAVSADDHEIGRIQGRQLGAVLPGGRRDSLHSGSLAEYCHRAAHRRHARNQTGEHKHPSLEEREVDRRCRLSCGRILATAIHRATGTDPSRAGSKRFPRAGCAAGH